MSKDLPTIIVVDLETTSVDPTRGGIIEVGAIVLTGAREGEEFECRCLPRDGVEIDPESLEYNGCDWLEGEDELTEAECVRSFLQWVGGDALLAGMNPYFDRWFAKVANEAIGPGQGVEFPFPHRTIDVHTLAVSHALAKGALIPARGLNSDQVMELLDLPREPMPHRAMAGARAEAEALRILLGLPNSLPEP